VANFGWAYINCGTTGSANGPTGSVQFMSGSKESTGSLNFMYHTAAYASYAANTMVLTGTLLVSGTISASHYHIENVTEIDASGSTYFGNTNDDVHIRTGSIYVGRSASTPLFSVDASNQQILFTAPLSASSTLHTVGAATFGSTIAATGSVTAASVTVTGDVTASVNVSASAFYGDGSNLTGIAGGGSPGGSDSQVQFNSGSSFGGSSNFVFVSTGTNTLKVVGDISASNDFQGGNDAMFGRDITAVRDIKASNDLSASNDIRGGRDLNINRDGAFVGTVTAAGIYSTGPISGSTTLHAEGAATFSSNLATTGSIVSYGGIRVSGSSYSYTLRDDSGNDMFKAEISSNHGRVRVRDSGNTVRVQLNGNGGVVSGSGTATFGAVSMDGTLTATTVTASGDVYGQTATFATVHLSGSETEALRIAKGASDTREIVFENEGTDVASIFMNSAETLIIKNESSNDDIQFQTKPGGSATTVMTVDGITAGVGIGTVAPLTKLDVRWSPTSLSDDTGGGDVVLFGSGTLTAGKLYYLHTDGAWTEVDADAVATGADQLLGIALGSDPTDDGVLIKGFFDATTYVSNFSAGKAIYVSTTAASMDTTAPSGTGDFVRIVGYCTDTANVIYFNPSSEWIELA